MAQSVLVTESLRKFHRRSLRLSKKQRSHSSDLAKAIGALIASRAKDAGVSTVVFDRAGNKYHGRIAAVADSARENGLEF